MNEKIYQFENVREWQRGTKQFHVAGERAAMRMQKEKFGKLGRHAKAYELNITRCPSPNTSIRPCGKQFVDDSGRPVICNRPSGHEENNMRHDFY